MEIARYARQDVDKVEQWPLQLLSRRYSTLARVVEREQANLEDT